MVKINNDYKINPIFDVDTNNENNFTNKYKSKLKDYSLPELFFIYEGINKSLDIFFPDDQPNNSCFMINISDMFKNIENKEELVQDFSNYLGYLKQNPNDLLEFKNTFINLLLEEMHSRIN